MNPHNPVAIRDQVLLAATDLGLGRGLDPVLDPWPMSRRGGTALFLTMLQDRLPSWLNRLNGLSGQPAADPIGVLTAAAISTIDFFAEMQTAGLGTFGSISELIRVRRALSTHGLTYGLAIEPLARYLRLQQTAGRIGDGDPEEIAELLLAGCFSQAFEELIFGADLMAPRPARAARLVHSLRLDLG